MSGSLGHVAGSRNASAVPHALHAIELRLYWKGATPPLLMPPPCAAHHCFYSSATTAVDVAAAVAASGCRLGSKCIHLEQSSMCRTCSRGRRGRPRLLLRFWLLSIEFPHIIKFIRARLSRFIHGGKMVATATGLMRLSRRGCTRLMATDVTTST